MSSQDLKSMHVDLQMSTKEISDATGIPISTVRRKLISLGVLRGKKEAINLAISQGKGAKKLTGRKREISAEWREKINISKRASADKSSKGFTVHPSGYLRLTRRGENSGRSVHVVVMEEVIGRKLFADECVHHVDHNKQNNDPSNLVLMTKREHASLHAKENHAKRKRSKIGQFA